jgi:hypothetical protein
MCGLSVSRGTVRNDNIPGGTWYTARLCCWYIPEVYLEVPVAYQVPGTVELPPYLVPYLVCDDDGGEMIAR